ncbi:MAG: hypothetical protein K9M97_00255 [Akkermansiaceae bacterium]|nr:hypothetical protein [Akkermansiaceae bacterium]
MKRNASSSTTIVADVLAAKNVIQASIGVDPNLMVLPQDPANGKGGAAQPGGTLPPESNDSTGAGASGILPGMDRQRAKPALRRIHLRPLVPVVLVLVVEKPA